MIGLQVSFASILLQHTTPPCVEEKKHVPVIFLPMAMIQAKMKAYADLPPVDDDVDLSFAATTFSDDDSGDGFDGADVKQLSPDEEGKRSPPPSSSFQSLRSKPQPVAGSAVPKHVAAGRYRSGSQNSPSSVRVLPPPHRHIDSLKKERFLNSHVWTMHL